MKDLRINERINEKTTKIKGFNKVASYKINVKSIAFICVNENQLEE